MLLVIYFEDFCEDTNYFSLGWRQDAGGGQAAKKIAHTAKNVNFAAQNVNARRRAKRSEKAWRRAKMAQWRPGLGDRFYCKRYRKSYNAYSDCQNAYPAADE